LSRLRSCNFFEFLSFFLPAFVVSYLQIQQTKNTCKYSRPKTSWFTNVLLSHIFAGQDKTSNLRDCDSKNGISRDQDHISRLQHCLRCSGETNILSSKCNVHLCLNQWWSLETYFCESRSRRLRVSRLWMLQRNSLVKFLKSNQRLFGLLYLHVFLVCYITIFWSHSCSSETRDSGENRRPDVHSRTGQSSWPEVST